MLAYGMGTNQILSWGMCASYGEIIIVLPEVSPADLRFVETTPLELYAENSYEGITLYLNQEWADFLQTYAIRVLFLIKAFYTDETPLFEVEGTLNYAEKTVTFALTRQHTDLVAKGYFWEISSFRESPDFYKIINDGRILVMPTLRRINDA